MRYQCDSCGIEFEEPRKILREADGQEHEVDVCPNCEEMRFRKKKMSEHPPGLFISDKVLLQTFIDVLDKYEGIFSMETDPRDFKRVGKMVITINGAPKDG